VRSEWEILDEQSGALGLTLWQALRDVLLWNETGPSERRGLFRPLHASQQDLLARAIAAAPELADALRDLAQLSAVPESADAARVAAACEAVWMWAEERGKHGIAIQFAEAAAKLETKSSSRSYTAGRLCRSAADYERGVIWFRRAERLARRTTPPSNIDFGNAHLGWGHLEHNRGNLKEAERHFWMAQRAALRGGRKSMAGFAHHNLIGLCIDAERLSDAVEHAASAATLYPSKHPRIPAVAGDIGYLWLRLGYFSMSMYLFANALPWIVAPAERSITLAMFARSAAAARDRVRYERLAEQATCLAHSSSERRDAVLYHIAEGARSFEQWDRANDLAIMAREFAEIRMNGTMQRAAERLLGEIDRRQPGDQDIIPEPGGIIDRITSRILKKLRRLPVPEPSDSGTVLFPERYPL
jgi:tetratricopeptide (TPR) repeat protein